MQSEQSVNWLRESLLELHGFNKCQQTACRRWRYCDITWYRRSFNSHYV